MCDLGNISLNKEIATCLLTGIFTDTGSFMHDSTTPAILKMAAKLMTKGARLSHIAHETYQKKDLPCLCIWGKALSRIMVSDKTGAAVSVITPEDMQECRAELDDLSGVVNLLNALPQAQFALLLAEYEPGKIKGSLRSEPHKNIDVSKLAKFLGGGGHKLASGFEVEGHLVEEEGMWRVRKAEGV
jgi:phosphoesterase RecJ-like protein